MFSLGSSAQSRHMPDRLICVSILAIDVNDCSSLCANPQITCGGDPTSLPVTAKRTLNWLSCKENGWQKHTSGSRQPSPSLSNHYHPAALCLLLWQPEIMAEETIMGW